MRVSDSLFTNNLLSQMNQLQSQQAQLQSEVTTGLKVSLPEDNPSAMSQALNLQVEASANSQDQSNITDLQNTATTAGSAMSNLQTIIEQASEIATEAGSLSSSSQLSSYVTEVANLIQEAVQAANSQDTQGHYIFGGTINNTTPFVVNKDASGNVTSVSYQGNASTSQSLIGSSQTVTVQVPGVNNTGSGATGLLADSRSGADLFSHLIALQQDLTSGRTTAITTTDKDNLTNDESNILNNVAQNGVVQSILQAAGTAATNLGTTLVSQSSDLTGADLATSITQLNQTETALQAAMQSGVKILNLSILDYIQ